MNVRKGLIRLWIVLSVVWMMFGGGFAWIAFWEKPDTASWNVDQFKAIQSVCERLRQDLLEQGRDANELDDNPFAAPPNASDYPCSSMIGIGFKELQLRQRKINNEALFSAFKPVAVVLSIFLGVTAVFWALLYTGFWIASGFRGAAMKAILRTGFLALAIMALAVPTNAGPLEDGVAAAERGDYATALRLYRSLAEQGDAKAQVDLGYMYQTGQGVPQDHAEAVMLYSLAAEQGDAIGQFNLGIMYRDGLGLSQDDAEAVTWFRFAAEQGFARAQYDLGVMYYNGQGVPQDYAEAVKLYRKAAAQNYALAMNSLGTSYIRGKGVPKDDAEAAKWFRKAAERGVAQAQMLLASMYVTGQGVPKDLVQALIWSSLAAVQGDEAAQRLLGAGADSLTPDQIAEVERMAREWMAKHQR